MNILLLHQYFKTPEQGGGIRSYHIATAMVAAGHDVTVITSSNEGSQFKNLQGIKVHYIKVPYANHFSFLRRLWAYWLFYLRAMSKSKSIDKVDLVYAISTPLSVGWLGKQISTNKQARFFFEVGDLWPEVPIQMGIVKNAFLKNWLYGVEQKIYSSSEVVIVLSSGMVDYVRDHGADKILVVPNMADIEYFQEKEQSPGKSGGLTIGYFGTIGLANHLEYLLDIAEVSQTEHLDIQFLVVGEGARKKSIEAQLRSRKIENIDVMGWQNMHDVRRLLNLCDAIYISFQNIPVLHTGSPNKLFDGLAAGKFVVSNLGGWSKKLIDEYDIGISYDPTKPNEFTEKVKAYLDDRSKIVMAQKNALSVAQTLFDKKALTKKIIDAIG